MNKNTKSTTHKNIYVQ